MGILVGWKAFVAAVIGGIGSIRGAVLGGFILGAVEVMAVVLLPSTYRDLISYSLLLVILDLQALRPARPTRRTRKCEL